MSKRKIKWHAFFNKLPGERRSSAEICNLLVFQEKQASIKEQASSSLEARNSSYNDNVVRSDFSS